MNPIYRVKGITTEKNINSGIIECNDVLLMAAGANSKDEVIGKTDYDLPWCEFADFYRAHELDALQGNNYSAIIPFKDHKNDYYLFLHTKIQKLNKNGVPIGISCHSVEVVNPNVYRLIEQLCYKNHINNKVVAFGKKQSKKALPRRQEEVLFYLVHGKSAKTTAKIMDISFRTVEHYIGILKNKFNCQTKNELIEMAINNGFAGNICGENNLNLLIEKLKTI